MTEKEKKIRDEEGIINRELSEDDYEYDDTGDLVVKPYTGSLIRNPNGANRGLEDPRQGVCWNLYMIGLKAGKPNASKAALDAGYSENTSKVVTGIKWFKDRKSKLRKKNFLTKAERNIGNILDLDYSSMKILDDGTEIEEVNIDKLRIVADMSKMIVQTLGKEDYSTKVIEEKNVAHDIKIESISYADPIRVEGEVVQDILIEEIKNE